MTYGVIVGERGDAAKWRGEWRPFRRGPGTPYRKLQTLRHLVTRDRAAVAAFLRAPLAIPRVERLRMLRSFVETTNALRGYHTLSEMLVAVEHILRRAGRPGLTVVEAGAGSGASTAKLSLAVRAAGGQLHVFDTFRGIPENDERHALLDGTPIRFVKGAFRGRLGAVKKRVAAHGAPEVCTFHKGLFDDTLPRFDGVVDVALLDVDLIGSTRTCLRELWPRLRPDGVVLSQDGHLRATRELFRDDAFFRDGLGTAPPAVRALCGGKLLELRGAARGGGDATVPVHR